MQRVDHISRYDYRPNQLIVKFKDSAPVKAASRRSVGMSSVDRAMAGLGIENIEALMPLTGAQQLRRSVPGINGKPVAAAPMDKAFLLTVNADVMEAVQTMRALGEVEYAEPNYLVHTLEADIPNDPYYDQQWGLGQVNMFKLWGEPCINKEGPVVAIIDTGVDINHPDLKNNIWTNTREEAGAKGYDDDGNGYRDDVHGWDFINNSPNVRDNNGHGTHCAGIVGATGYNGLGIIGACPFAQIMPITAMQVDGTGDMATLIKAVDYATANGAQIISMSLGSYASSIAFEQALARAYQKAVIVAAAGNDGYCLNHAHPEKGQPFAMPMFPAAYTFVLGVQAAGHDGSLASFSNYDDDGPVFSEYPEEQLYNYEITAPGVSIVSTFPGGNYRALNGTSMATPLVAGAIARYMMSREVTNKEDLFGDLIYSAKNGLLDIYAAYSITDADRRPTLALVSYRIDDEKMGDADGRLDAGETIRLYPKFRNAWGHAHNIIYRLALDELEDPEIIEWMDADESHMLSGLSSYASAEAESPFIFKVSPDCADGRKIHMVLTATCDNISEPLTQHMYFTVENGVELKGVLTKDMTLTPDKNYIVTGNFVIGENTTLTIEPGVKITFKGNAGLSVADGDVKVEEIVTDYYKGNSYNIGERKYSNAGRIIANGTPGSQIIFQGSSTDYCSNLNFGYNSELNYCVFTGFSFEFNSLILTRACRMNNPELRIKEIIDENTITNTFLFFNQIGTGYARNILIHDNLLYLVYTGGLATIDKYVFANEAHECIDVINNKCRTNQGLDMIYGRFSNVINHHFRSGYSFSLYKYCLDVYSNIFNVFEDKNPDINRSFWLSAYDGDLVSPNHAPYLGTGRKDIAETRVVDINQGYGMAQYDFSTMRTRPYSQAHGIVWKVVVNDYDAQDEYELMPPLGVGRHKVEVYFNREMDHSVAPTIAMGVRAPYTQTAIGEEGTWRSETFEGEDGPEVVDIYTAYITITGRQNIDGVNRIYVADARDDEYFDIPVENVRFNVNVQAAGSLSTGFFGESGVGCVKLEWEDMDVNFDDILGYNIYRSTADTEPVRINASLIEPDVTNYTDYDVKTGTTYLYYYKVMTTSLVENDPSKTIAVTPLTAAMGDANGSGDVDVNDILTTVSYIGGGDPKPFIFEAADVNADADINILDVVGIAHTILDGPAGAESQAMPETAYYWVEDGQLWLRNTSEIGGVQVLVNADRKVNDILPTEALEGLETMGQWRGNDEYIFLAFSLSGATIAAGDHAILDLGEGVEIDQIVLGDTKGRNVPVEKADTEGVANVAADTDDAAAEGIYNAMGVKVAADASALDRLPAGIYIVNGTKVAKR